MKRSFVPLAAAALVASLSSPHALAQRIRLDTSMGDVVVELDAAKAPKTTDNFIRYVTAGHYDGTIFHRVINGFMIQGGGMTEDMNEKPARDPITLESRNGLRNRRGTVAMARTPDPHSARAQFFINLKDNDFLDQANARDGHGYAVFGKVVEGMAVVDRIAAVKTGDRAAHQNVPLAPVVIRSAKVEK